jgi:hypothetical protein
MKIKVKTVFRSRTLQKFSGQNWRCNSYRVNTSGAFPYSPESCGFFAGFRTCLGVR